MSFNPGSTVMVQWSDGNQYPAQVMQYQDGQVLVSFPNGQQQWIGEQYVSASGPAPAPMQVGNVQAAGGDFEIDGDIEVYDSAQEYMAELQGVIHQVESQRVPMPGVDPNDPATLWTIVFALQKTDAQGIARAQAVQQYGFSGEDHFNLVMRYVEAKWSHIGTDDEGRPAVVQRPEYTNAMMQASMGQMMQAQADAAGADPSLLAPVAGVSIELWARASVLLGSLGEGATVEQMAHKLAEIGIDKPTYDTASEGWMAKMQGDTTGAIATKYGEAFMQAQSGAAAGTNGGAAGGAAASSSNEPPCTFELYVEVGSAMGCWSDQGFDVNAKMQEVFCIDAMAYSRYSTYWGMKMATDITLLNQQEQLDAKFRQKYAGADLDADLVL